MANWNEVEYEKRARDLARLHLVNKKSLNDLSEKVARDENLNPEEIRTLVRLANVATFQELFKAKDGGDKMVEFENGDPEQVIQRLMAAPSAEGAPPETANIHNDKLSSFTVPDMVTEKRLGQKFDAAVTKTAEEIPERVPRREMAIILLQKYAKEMDLSQKSADYLWEDKVNRLSRVYRRVGGPELEELEKDAYAEYGADAYPELAAIHQVLRRPSEKLSDEKIAHLKEHHVVADSLPLELFKAAYDTRKEYEKFGRGRDYIENQLAQYGT